MLRILGVVVWDGRHIMGPIDWITDPRGHCAVAGVERVFLLNCLGKVISLGAEERGTAERLY